MMNVDEKERILSRGLPNIHHVNDTTMVISYLRGPLLLIFNFHSTTSHERYSVGVEEAGEYQVILNSDEKRYGGQALIEQDRYIRRTVSKRMDGLRNCLEVPLPDRSAQVSSAQRQTLALVLFQNANLHEVLVRCRRATRVGATLLN